MPLIEPETFASEVVSEISVIEVIDDAEADGAEALVVVRDSFSFEINAPANHHNQSRGRDHHW